MSKKSLFGMLRRATAFILSCTIATAAVCGTDMGGIKAYAADSVSFVGIDNGASGDQTIKGDQNLGTIDTSAGINYWFAGNAFYGMERSGAESNESYDDGTWYLVDTDAMWNGNYLYSQFGNSGNSSSSNLTAAYSSSYPYYFTKILSYGEELWEQYSDEWFTGQEASAVGTATVATTGYNSNYTYSVNDIEYENNTGTYYDKYSFSGINDSTLGLNSSNTYALEDAHLYVPSYAEYSANSSVYPAIITNIHSDYLTKTSSSYYSAAKTTVSSDPMTGTFYDRSRTYLWSRSFYGVYGNSYLYAWDVDSSGTLSSNYNVASAKAVAPAFNLDVSNVVMARSATATVSPDSSLASYNPNDFGSDVTFTMESDSLSLTTDIANQKLLNVVGGQTYSISYSGANLIGEETNDNAKVNLYISAAIYDSNDEIVYYGQLAKVSSTGSGTVELTIPDTLLVGEEYKLALFEEQINGSYAVTTPSNKSITTYTTDYVSPMNVATFTLESISAEANDDAYLTEGTSYYTSDIATMISVTSVSSGELVYGTDYTIISVSDGNAAILNGGTIVMTGDVSSDSETLVLEVGYIDSDMAAVPTTTVEIEIRSDDSSNDGTYLYNFYSYEDEETGITWNYKINSAGNIVYLYTTDDPSGIINSAGELSIPKTVAGLTVTGVGGGSFSTPFVPTGKGDWTSISFPSSVTSINDYAFANAEQTADVVIPKTVTSIGEKAFYESNIASLKINDLTGEVGNLAFALCDNLQDVTIKGVAAVLDEESFANSAIADLNISGTVFIKENAFENVTGITELYLPNGVDAYAYAFNGCTGITTLETDMSVLYNDAFIGCTAINLLILDDNVCRVEYDWNGHTSSVDRKIYVKNSSETYFQFYYSGDAYYSAYGTSGAATVVYDDATGVDTGSVDDNMLTALTNTLAENSAYSSYYYGQATSVTFVYVGASMTVEEYMEEQGVSDIYIVSDVQTSIDVSFSGSLMVDMSIDKDDVTVTALYGSSEGNVYDTDHFYVIRLDNFNTLLASGSITESNVASYEPMTATEDDIASGLYAAVVVFSSLDGDGVYTGLDGDYYYQTLSIRVEDSDAEAYLVEEYGSYEAILAEISSLLADIAEMEDFMKDIIASVNDALGTSYDEDADDLTSEYESAVNALVEALTEANDALSQANADNAENIALVQSLISTINSMYGTSIITLPDSATTSEISEAISEALQAIQDDQSEKDATILMLTENYVDIAQMLADYLSDTENLEADAVDGTTVSDIKAAIASALADLEEAKEKLTAIDSALNSLYSTLNDALASMGLDITLDYSEDSTVAEKIAAISAVIEQIAEAYNNLLSEYNSLSSDYQTIISYVYGDDTTGDVSADDIVAQIESNQQAAIDEAVEEALSDAEYLSSVSESVQDSIAEVINEIMDGEDVSTDGLSSDLVDALSAVQEMQANVTSMQASIDGYTSVLSAIRSALDLDDTATTSEVLSAISSLKDQVAALTEQVATLTSENAALTAENTNLTVQVTELTSELEEMTEANTALTSKIGTLTSENENLETQVETLTAQIEALSGSSDAAETISNLTSQVASLTSENENLALQVESLTSENENLETQVETLTAQVEALSSSSSSSSGTSSDDSGTISTLTEQVSSLTSENEALEEQVESLTSENESLTSQVSSLTAQVSSLNSANSTLTSQVETLTSSNTSLTSKVTSLNSQISSLTSQIASLSSSSDDTSSTVSSLSAQVSSLTSDNNALNAEVSSLTSENSSLALQVSSLTEQIASLTSENASLNDEVSTLSNDLSSLQSASTSTAVTTSKSTTSVSSLLAASAADETADSTSSNETLSGSDNDDDDNEISFHALSDAVEQGTAVEITAPTSDVAYKVSSDQTAATEVIQLASSNDNADLITNAESYVKSSSYQRSIATLIITYYANHLDELGDLGSQEIKEAATDSNKTVTVEMLYSIDVEATEEQLADMEENGSAELTLTSDAFEDGETYLVVHESELREDAYDVLLVTAEGNDLTFSLPDFSPVTVAKVSISSLTDETISSSDAYDDTTEEEETEESIEAFSDVEEEAAQSGSNVGTIVVCIIIVVIFIAAVIGLLFMMKKRQDK